MVKWVKWAKMGEMGEMGGTHRPLLLFDGVCNLCNRTVQFILKHEMVPAIFFASLQSEYAQSVLIKLNIEGDLDTIVFISNDSVLLKSDAAIEVSRFLRWPCRLGIFTIVPRAIRDKVYDWVAKNRYRWFGKLEACPVPSKEVRKRFLD